MYRQRPVTLGASACRVWLCQWGLTLARAFARLATNSTQKGLNMTYQGYKHAVQQLFAFYGFTGCPLTDDQIGNLHQMGASIDDAYEIGCDIAAGVDADRAFKLTLHGHA